MKIYLCTIARNLYFNYLKRADNRNLSLDEVTEKSSEKFVEQQTLDRLTAQQIHRALHILDEPYKEVFTLRIFAVLKYGDIGALFGKTDSWARVVKPDSVTVFRDSCSDELVLSLDEFLG